MTQCNILRESFQGDIFPDLKRRKIEVDFEGGEVSSDGGVLLLRQVDRKLGLLRRAAKILSRYDAPNRKSGARHAQHAGSEGLPAYFMN